jgi:WD40 repeat protein
VHRLPPLITGDLLLLYNMNKPAIEVRHVLTGQLVHTLVGSDDITCMSLVPGDTDLLVTGGWEKHVNVWDVCRGMWRVCRACAHL